uniref:Uncharacterized protein n=1 Tax=Oryza nivara TaxID=4536 RepID=A0A0E0HFR6_ORYNI
MYVIEVYGSMRWSNAKLKAFVPGDEGYALADWWLQNRARCRTSYRASFDCLFILATERLWGGFGVLSDEAA